MARIHFFRLPYAPYGLTLVAVRGPLLGEAIHLLQFIITTGRTWRDDGTGPERRSKRTPPDFDDSGPMIG